jgi:uncharacterized RDD family membrane protein YckC/DNA-directed RNA polymerase subunit RPC12/RpoP
MSSLTAVQVEFRCNRCWFSNCADAELEGKKVACRNCGQSVTVPEATPERIDRAAALIQELQQQPVTSMSKAFNHIPSDAELYEIARKESYVPRGQRNYSGYPTASCTARLIAAIVDGVLVITSIMSGFAFSLWLAKHGIFDDPMELFTENGQISNASLATIYSFYALLVFCQWCLLTLHGQTIGKFVMMIRVVSISGQLPGFVQGVLLRNWLRNLLSMIPLFSLIDILFIFSPSGRCLHDYLAGTKVVSNI